MLNRKQISLALVLTVLLAIMSCQGNKKDTSGKQTMEVANVEISINGMTCTGCEQTIKAGITQLDGVQSVTATFTDGRAVVTYIPGKTDTLKMKEVITGKGYTVKKFTQLTVAEEAAN